MMSFIKNVGKCPICTEDIIFGDKKVMNSNEGLVCPHCDGQLRHNRIKLVIVFIMPIFPMVIIGSQYPIWIRLITLMITIFIIYITWITLGYELRESEDKSFKDK